MLRMYCLQQWYGEADDALEDALYDSQVLRDFVGVDLSRELMVGIEVQCAQQIRVRWPIRWECPNFCV